jgi:GNAT superfamily N-acetyltransferase
MRDGDALAVHAASVAAFTELSARMDDPPYPQGDPERAAIRVRHLIRTDPGGAWVAERDGALCGAALALVREGIWGLSLLVVAPAAQSAGVGRELLARAWAHAEGAHGFLVLASRDPRALRSYVRLGLDLHPAVRAHGRPRGVAAPDGLRPWRGPDRAWADELARGVRGAAHGDDVDALLAAGAQVHVLPERGYMAVRGSDLNLLVAADDDAGVALLGAHLAAAGDAEASVDWMTSQQQWAVRTCVAAGLDLYAHGAVLTGGRLGRMSPYLPSGAYL